MFLTNWLQPKNTSTVRPADTNPKRKRGPLRALRACGGPTRRLLYGLESLEPRTLLATFQGLGDAPGGAEFQSEARAISGDGLTVVGPGFRWTSPAGMQAIPVSGYDVSYDGSVITAGLALWTETGGVVSLGELPGGYGSGSVRAVSFDGSVVAGYDPSTQFPSQEGFRWTAMTGMVGLGALPGSTEGSLLQGISGNGQVIVGRDNGDGGGRTIPGQAVKWTESGGWQGLGWLPGTPASRASGASYDGSVIVGWSYEAFRWVDGQGMTGLGLLPGMNQSWAFDVSADGSVVVGQSYVDDSGTSPTRAFIWESIGGGMRDLQNELVNVYGLGAALAGWELTSARDISADGQVIAGNGINPLGLKEAWIVNLAANSGLLNVDAGPHQTISVAGMATLDATVTGAVAPTFQWSVVSGPGTVTFGDATAEDTTARFSASGIYQLKLTATDGAFTAIDAVYVVVNPLSADLTAVADTYISNASKEATKNFGTGQSLISDGNPDKGTLVRWDVSGIAPGSTIQSATLSFNVTGTSGDGYEVYEVLRNWAETQATWSKATATTNWQTAGAQGATDRVPTVLGTITASTAGVRTIALGADGLAAVQRWVDNPSANYGLILQDYANSTNDDLVISSRESGVSANRPRLILTYDPPPGSPSSVLASVASAPARSREVGSALGGQRPLATSTDRRLNRSEPATLDTTAVDAAMRLYASRRARATHGLDFSAP